jgi:hypothetical protein
MGQRRYINTVTGEIHVDGRDLEPEGAYSAEDQEQFQIEDLPIVPDEQADINTLHHGSVMSLFPTNEDITARGEDSYCPKGASHW